MTKPHDASKPTTDVAADEREAAGPGGVGPALGTAAAGAPAGTPPPAEPSLEEQLAQLKDKWLRARAELDNVQRRSRLDVEDARRYGATPLLLELLGVLDALQRALVQAREGAAAQLLEGLQLTERLFLSALENHGVVPLSAAPGEAFDPGKHRALVEQPSGDVAPGTILAELVRGYRLRDRLLREAQVVVAQRPASGAGGSPEGGDDADV